MKENVFFYQPYINLSTSSQIHLFTSVYLSINHQPSEMSNYFETLFTESDNVFDFLAQAYTPTTETAAVQGTTQYAANESAEEAPPYRQKTPPEP